MRYAVVSLFVWAHAPNAHCIAFGSVIDKSPGGDVELDDLSAESVARELNTIDCDVYSDGSTLYVVSKSRPEFEEEP